MDAKGERKLNTDKDMRWALAMMWGATAFAGLLSVIAILLSVAGEVEDDFIFLVILSSLTTIMFLIRVIWLMRANSKLALPPIDWTSAALAPERAAVVSFCLMLLMAFTVTSIYGDDAPTPQSAVTVLIFGVFLGLPLIEMFVTKARPWRLLINGFDPD